MTKQLRRPSVRVLRIRGCFRVRASGKQNLNIQAGAYLAVLGESGLLETIRASPKENRVDLYLKPIVDLPQRKLRFHETLALDFAKLKTNGFRHIKVRAETLMRGMSSANVVAATEDFKKLLERHGLNLIAERVEDEKTVVQLLDYTVDFARSYLFGSRAVRDDSLKPMEKEPAPGSVITLRGTG